MRTFTHCRKNCQRAEAGLFAVCLLAATAARAEPPRDVAALGWLAGCWAAEGREAGSGEQWTAPAGGTVLGTSRTVRRGRTVEFEFMRIQADGEGRLVFTALPSGQRETTFTAVAGDEKSVSFENPQHDFPQRVIYTLRAEGRLLARIEGTRQGTTRTIDFPYQRVACPGG